MIEVVEDAQRSGGVSGAEARTIETSGVRGIEFAQHLTDHFGEVVVVVDGGEELLVFATVEIPISSVKIGAVEFFAGLTPDVLEHFCALGGEIEGDFGAVGE